MALTLRELIDPSHTALVTQECQGGVIGAQSILPQLRDAAVDTVIPNGALLLGAARAASVPVVHCVAARRADSAGSNSNARLFGATSKLPPMLPGSAAAMPIPEFGPDESDLVLTRLHGLGPMGGTDLDPVLRNLGAQTIVGIGVSVNIGMLSFAMDAVNAGYQMVLVSDAVAGVPAEYADAVLANTLSLIATLATTQQVLDAWS